MPLIADDLSPISEDFSVFSESASFDDEEFSQENETITPIAIIGFAFRGPGDATSSEAFWDLLNEKRTAASDYPSERLNLDAFYRDGERRVGELPLKQSHFVKDDIRAFDAGFFSISPAEASAMDPMQRILLETAYQGFENAGIPLSALLGSNTSVYTGSFTTDYQAQLTKDPATIPTYGATGGSASILANRISWFFDLKGPSVNLDSACSSSGMALDLACENLRNGNTNMSLVGGCNLCFSPEYFTMLTNLKMLSDDGRCFSFDSRANGYARGEGFGTVVLKRLDDAIANGDTIRAVIRSTGCNHGGRMPGITQPSKFAQEALVRETYRKAALSMKPTRFCETHGTGTALGDPIESMALGRAFKESRTNSDPLILGAVKSNIGHLEGASGIAGLIKTVLVLESGYIPPNANFEKLNPKIDPEYLSIKIPQEIMRWPSNGLRRASVNSFGFGGANSHVILDDAYNFLRLRNLHGKHQTRSFQSAENDRPEPLSRADSFMSGGSDRTDFYDGLTRKVITPKILFFSANTKDGLKRVLDTYSDHLNRDRKDKDSISVEDLAYTLDSRRSHLRWRSYVSVASDDDLKRISSLASMPAESKAKPPRIGFVFTGQGAQWFGMGRELMVYPAFRASVKKSDMHLFKTGCPWLATSLIDGNVIKMVDINDTVISQTLCTIVQIGIVDLLAHFRVTASAVAGHSSGEIAAAYCSGAITRKTAIELAYHRGYYASTLSARSPERGGMIALGISGSEAQPFIDQVKAKFSGPWFLHVACYNSPKSITVSGPQDQIHELKVFLDAASVFNRVLSVPVAYHSPQMEIIAADYRDAIGAIPEAKMSIPMISSVSGTRADAKSLQTAEYWVKNMVSPVRFSEALQYLTKTSPKSVTKKLDRSHLLTAAVDMLIEIGPHSALKGSIKDSLKESSRGSEIEYCHSLLRNKSGVETIQHLVSFLHCRGSDVDLRRLNDPMDVPRSLLINLPAYPFDRSQHYWYESRIGKDFKFRSHGYQEFLGTQALGWSPLAPQWRLFIRTKELPWVEDHKINGATPYPASGMLVMAAEAATQLTESLGEIEGYEYGDTRFSAAINIPASGNIEVRIALHPSEAHKNSFAFTISSVTDETNWVENCTGDITVYLKADHSQTLDFANDTAINYDTLVRELDHELSGNEFYNFLWQMGYGYGPAFQKLEKIQYDSSHHRALAQMHPYRSSISKNSIVHPATLDAILHLRFANLFDAGTNPVGTFVPTKFDSLWIDRHGLNHPDEYLNVATVSHESSFRHARSSAKVFNQAGDRTLLRAEGIELTLVAGAAKKAEPAAGSEHSLKCIHMEVDPDLHDAEQMRAYLEEMHPKEDTSAETHDLFRRYIQHCLKHTQQHFSSTGLWPTSPRTQAYMKWAQSQIDSTGILSDTDLETIRVQVSQLGAKGQLIAHIGQNLTEALLNQSSPRQTLNGNDNLVDAYYHGQASTKSYYKQLFKYIELLAHKTPDMKILEIRGGNVSLTPFILKALSSSETEPMTQLRCSEYHFTDVDGASVDIARGALKALNSKLKFQVLDPEMDVATQGFEGESFDLVIDVSPSSVTRRHGGMLSNVRKLLKPGGRLLLRGASTHDLVDNFTWGVLPQWWSGDSDDCSNDPERSNHTLTSSGFSDTNLILHDHTSHQATIAITRAISPNNPIPITSQPPITILISATSTAQHALATTLQSHLALQTRSPCTVTTLSSSLSASTLSTHRIISLLDTVTPFFPNLNELDYTALQRLFKHATTILWVTHGGGEASNTPGYNMVQGFARPIRVEHAGMKFTTLALEPSGEMTGEQAGMMVRVLEAVERAEAYEHDYTVKKGRVYVERMVETGSLTGEFLARMARDRPVERRLGELPPMKLGIGTRSQLDTLEFVVDDGGKEEIMGGEVEVKVAAVGLDALDHSVATGRSDESNFGRVCAGVVTSVHQECDFEVGQRVLIHGRGHCSTHVRASHQFVIPLPDDVSFEQACAIPHNLITASYAIHELAKLVRGDIIVLDCAGSLLQASLSISHALGLSVFVLAKNDSDKLSIVQEYDIPVEKVLVVNPTLKYTFMASTGGRGADAVLSTRANAPILDVLSPLGTVVNIDDPARQTAQINPGMTVINLDIAMLARVRPHLLRPAWARALESAASWNAGEITTYTASNVKAAFEFISTAKLSRNVVLRFDPEDVIQTKLPPKHTYSLVRDATYLVTGAFGGLGRSAVRWLAMKGATNLLLLSRSGARSDEAKQLVAELEAQGVRVAAPACDVANGDDVRRVIAAAGASMPAVRGCLHLAVSGRDLVFETMPYASWQTRMAAKVHGTLHLHTHLPSSLDFFGMTSSVGAITAMISMSAYAAANSFLDDFSRHINRRSGGKTKAFSISYGPAEDIGMLEGQGEMFERLMRFGQYVAVSDRELLAFLEYYCDPGLKMGGLEEEHARPVVGIQTPGQMLARGLELPVGFRAPFWNNLLEVGDGDEGSGAEKSNGGVVSSSETVKMRLGKAASDEEAHGIAAEALVKRVARITSMAEDNIDVAQPIHTFGIDSLTAVELRNWIAGAFEYNIAVFDILSSATVDGVVKAIVREVRQ
ncbi:hypothetical protein BU24DRAFT_481793 [Aaosphaeria arxii CBS 175.79]|uniref:Uncharacterized protein n=1 Tax=Aaosphaeria arxii CBS 175.79 TaxID=1450172 RepID=A0A6A5XNK7_9PLEO|nr:uncharacterized protein BU24DRAFT_481793 [Aaosphaeria arxii CBS 175.79]KAF2014351.1 hypothetical protein BU24DRAFT_481793 [Aaosphaeria arxii CBS 175.79]